MAGRFETPGRDDDDVQTRGHTSAACASAAVEEVAAESETCVLWRAGLRDFRRTGGGGGGAVGWEVVDLDVVVVLVLLLLQRRMLTASHVHEVLMLLAEGVHLFAELALNVFR